MTRQEIKKEISDLKKAMRIDGIKRVACFNGGLDSLTRRCNARLFELETRLQKTP